MASPGQHASQRSYPLPLLLFYGLCVIGALEVGLRLFWVKQLVLGAGIDHPHFHHRLLSDRNYHFVTSEFDVMVQTNRYGLRGVNPVIPKPNGRLRLLLLGDSYTFGFPVQDEETFAHLTEIRLQQQGYPLEVVNGGVSGYSPTLHYISLRDEFLQFEPDLVVLWFDLGDVMEDHNFKKNLLYDEHGTILRADPCYINGKYDRWGFIMRHSALARYLNNKLVRTVGKVNTLGLRGYLQAKLRGERTKVAIARLKRAQHATDLAQNDKFLLVREDATRELLEPYWLLTAGYLRKIRDLLAEKHVPLMVGIYPYGMLVGSEEWGDGRIYWGFEKGRTYEAEVFRTLVRDFCRDEGIPLIDSFEAFRAAAGGEPLYYNWDGHFTPKGHRVLAERFATDAQLHQLLGTPAIDHSNLSTEKPEASQIAPPS